MSTTSSRPRDVFISSSTGSTPPRTRSRLAHPIAGHFIGVRPGPDRPDYCFIALRDPITVGGRRVRMLVVCARVAATR